MKNMVFYPDFRDYKQSIFDMFCDKDLINHPFYQNLALFVCDHRSPIYYDISDHDEHFAFSGAYHFMTRRLYAGEEGQLTRQSIFFMHDFTHLLFPYPHNVLTTSLEQFIHAFTYQERIASTETEIMSYYRVPHLREKVFSDEVILFDTLGPMRPNPAEFLAHRNRLIMDDDYGKEHLGSYPQVLKWMQSWRYLTPTWCEKRYWSVKDKNIPQYNWRTLNVSNYESVITNYKHVPAQTRYERNILRNLSMAYALLDLPNPPTCFSEAKDAFDLLNGAVILR
jgi:hypothetical protein